MNWLILTQQCFGDQKMGEEVGKTKKTWQDILMKDIKVVKLEIAKPWQAANDHASWRRLIT